MQETEKHRIQKGMKHGRKETCAAGDVRVETRRWRTPTIQSSLVLLLRKENKDTKYTDEFVFNLFKYSVSKYINIQPKSHN